MEVVILGSGTCVPSLRRAGPSTLVKASGRHILVDSASGTLRQLLRAGVAYDEVDVILYTHLHPDHVGELVPYLFATKYAPGFSRREPVFIYGAEGFRAFHSALVQAFGEWVVPEPGRVVFEEVPVSHPAAVQSPPLVLRTSPVRHTAMSLAWRIEDEKGRSVVVSGDTDYCGEIVELARGADILVLECAMPEGHKVEGHLVPSEAGRIASEAGVGCLVLTHFYPECDLHDMEGPVREHYDGRFILARDLEHVRP